MAKVSRKSLKMRASGFTSFTSPESITPRNHFKNSNRFRAAGNVSADQLLSAYKGTLILAELNSRNVPLYALTNCSAHIREHCENLAPRESQQSPRSAPPASRHIVRTRRQSTLLCADALASVQHSPRQTSGRRPALRSTIACTPWPETPPSPRYPHQKACDTNTAGPNQSARRQDRTPQWTAQP